MNGSNLQLAAAILLTIAALLMLVGGRGRAPGFNSNKLAALLMGMAAAVNWVLYFALLD